MSTAAAADVAADQAARSSPAGGDGTPWMVNKFGGTSVASANAMRAVKDIVMDQVKK